MEYIKIKQVLDDVLDDEMMSGCKFERAVKWSVDFIRKVNMPMMYEAKIAPLDIHNHMAQLPCDFISIKGLESVDMCNHNHHAYVASSSTFEPTGLSYRIKGNVLWSSKKEDRAMISYLAIKVDEEGYPMIPDNGKVAPALEWYIKKQYIGPKFCKGEVNANVMNYIDQNYYFAVGQAQTSLINPSIDEMETFNHQWQHMLAGHHEHRESFRNLDKPEILKF